MFVCAAVARPRASDAVHFYKTNLPANTIGPENDFNERFPGS